MNAVRLVSESTHNRIVHAAKSRGFIGVYFLRVDHWCVMEFPFQCCAGLSG
jgi:hypothetical protein